MKIERLFDSGAHRAQSDDLLAQVSLEEKVQWLNHPCTMALLMTLKGDYIELHAAWESGEFVDQVADGTAQQNAKALGSLDEIRLIAEYIEGVASDD